MGKTRPLLCQQAVPWNAAAYHEHALISAIGDRYLNHVSVQLA